MCPSRCGASLDSALHFRTIYHSSPSDLSFVPIPSISRLPNLAPTLELPSLRPPLPMSTDRNNGTATPREDSEREEGIVEVSGGLEDETEDEGGCGVG